MPKANRKERFCDCPACAKQAGRTGGQRVPYSTWYSHQARKNASKHNGTEFLLASPQPAAQPQHNHSQDVAHGPGTNTRRLNCQSTCQSVEDGDNEYFEGINSVHAGQSGGSLPGSFGVEAGDGCGDRLDAGDVQHLLGHQSSQDHALYWPTEGDEEHDRASMTPQEFSSNENMSGSQHEDVSDGLPSDHSLSDAQDVILYDHTPGSPQQDESPNESFTSEDKEQEPFRFEVPDTPPPSLDLSASDDLHPFWAVILLLVSYLNLRFHLPHRACNLILTVLRIVFLRLGLFGPTDKPVVTLRTAFNTLGLKDPFLILPMCPNCRRIFPSDSPSELKCYKCFVPLFKSKSGLRVHFDGSDDTTEDKTSTARLKCPFYPLSAQLPSFVRRFENELQSSLQVKREDGIMKDIRDGRVWRTLTAKDGTPFFSPTDPDAIRIGLILHFDGFSGERARSGTSYSSGVLSFAVANLPAQMRYKPENLLVVTIVPGPKELTCDELQFVLEAVVDDEIRLYEEGITVKTPSRPNGRDVKTACVANACDHPAMCRICGFADHSHLTRFCTKCMIPRRELGSMDAFTGGFLPRTGNDHIRHAKKYKTAEPGDEPHQRDGLFAEYGAQYYAMSRLQYFDPVKMSVIDPMHNVLLGLCRSQWLDTWIRRKVLRERTAQKERELDQIHAYLHAFEMPSWVGRLPHKVGYPAGGSLSADEYKALVLVYCPVIIPLIWTEWQPLAQEEFNKAMRKWEINESDPTMEPFEQPKLRMHPDDADNFLKLAAALKIILGRSIQLTDIPRAENLLREYLIGYLSMHTLDVKPNHHWVTHVFEQIHDFGPVYGFWTFTSERLNKVLKSFTTNNHNGGEIETSFLRAFCKNTVLRRLLHSLSSSPSHHDGGLSETAALLSNEDKDIRGTVASINSMVQEVEDQTRDSCQGFKRPCVGPSIIGTLEDNIQLALLQYYHDAHPDANVCGRTTSRTEGGNHLVASAKFHLYIIKDGRRITPSSTAEKAPNSIIHMEFDGQIFAGQVISIIQHRQFLIDRSAILLHVRWFRRSYEIDATAWDKYPELEVFFWEYNSCLPINEAGPALLITPDLIKSQAARATVMMREPRLSDDDKEDPKSTPLWVTIGLSRENIVV